MLDGLFLDLVAEALELPLRVASGTSLSFGSASGHQFTPADRSTSPKRS